MSKLEELEMVIDSLSEKEYREFRRWFLERDWANWDRQIEADSAAGRLDFLYGEAQEAKVVAGTRVPVDLILEKLGAGETVEEILQAHPRLTRDGVLAALTFVERSV